MIRKKKARPRLLFVFWIAFAPGVHCCLSNPRMPCSVAANQPSCHQSQPPSSVHTSFYSYQHDNVYATGQYQGFLGNQIQARAYSEMASTNEFAKVDQDLQCINVTTCTWHNDPGDQLDWVTGTGEVALAKLNIITGSTIVPGPSFLILASDPRPPVFAGALISKPIACQSSAGLLSFRYWRSRARTLGQEPDLDVCTRKVPESTLQNCLTIEPTENHTILASIPPMTEPFEIVIRGYGFENEPEGGLIILDFIDYFAGIDTAENCAAQEANTIPPEAIVEPNEEELLVTSTQVHKTVSRDVERRAELVDNSIFNPKDIMLIQEETGEDSCKSLECNLEESNDDGCLYRRVGTGAKGEGFRVGWKVAHLSASPSNPLTGIHKPLDETNEPNFLVAEFPGFERTRREHRYVLESSEFILEEKAEAFLSFKKYMATQAVELHVCSDFNATLCFWDAFQNSAEPFSRRWTKEVVKLPSNINKFFIICTQDVEARANVGQVGISSIAIFADPEATIPFC